MSDCSISFPPPPSSAVQVYCHFARRKNFVGVLSGVGMDEDGRGPGVTFNFSSAFVIRGMIMGGGGGGERRAA